MADRTMPCRVCGKLFVPCGKSSSDIGAFNYREIACSPECGEEYLKRVLEGRKAVSDNAQITFDELETLQETDTIVESNSSKKKKKKNT